MPTIDRVVFGDNQFFGINHMSQEKALALAMRFHYLDDIFTVYQAAFDAGVRAVMLNSNDRAAAICARFRDRASQYPALAWYPSIPYPHKYANLVSEKGIMAAVNSVVFKDTGALAGLGKLAQGGLALVSRDIVQLAKMLIDAEMRMFRGLDVRVVFLQNVLTDLVLGLGVRDFFVEYTEHIRRKYGATPGLITQNLPLLRDRLQEWGVEGVVICASVNKIGYLMSPGREAYEQALADNNPARYPVMAMSTLASGAIPAPEAYDYINRLNLQSIVFGASSRSNIEQTLRCISPQPLTAKVQLQ
jgi:hypothetical protein